MLARNRRTAAAKSRMCLRITLDSPSLRCTNCGCCFRMLACFFGGCNALTATNVANRLPVNSPRGRRRSKRRALSRFGERALAVEGKARLGSVVVAHSGDWRRPCCDRHGVPELGRQADIGLAGIGRRVVVRGVPVIMVEHVLVDDVRRGRQLAGEGLLLPGLQAACAHRRGGRRAIGAGDGAQFASVVRSIVSAGD